MAKERVLVVEDEEFIAQCILEIFSINEYQTNWAANGTEALAYLQSNEYDLILCDINLPDIDGYQILKSVRGNLKIYRTPFIFLSAYAGEDEIRMGMNKGADDYITKPFTIQTLLDAVEARLEIGRAQTQLYKTDLSNKWLELLNANFNAEFLYPLNDIISAGFLIEKALPDENKDQFRNMIQSINVSGHRMLRNTKKLIAFAMISSNPDGLNNDNLLAEVQLDEVVNQALVSYASERVDFYNQLNVYIHPIGSFKTNHDYIKIVVEELMDNMINFNVGENKPSVYLNSSNGKPLISFVNHLDQPLDFNISDIAPFKRFHEDKTKKGLGIGLYLVKRLCELLNVQLNMQMEDESLNVSISFP